MRRAGSPVVAFVTIAVTFCKSAPPPSLTSHEVATLSKETGAVAAKEIADPNAPQVKLAPDEEFVRPELIRGRAPQYPPDLLQLRLPMHVVAVRVLFDERGRPIEVTRSPIAESTEDQYQPQFEAAVRTAVEEWKCYPPRIRKFRPGEDLDGDGKPDYRILASQQTLKTFYDLSFSFEVINGQPVVKNAAGR